MWRCPKCNREFRNTNQDHYCGKVETIDQYIAEQVDEVRPILQKIREVIRGAAPNAIEKISWQMPTFWQGENLMHFASFKKHISIFPGSGAVEVFADRLAEYKTAKGTIQFPLDKPMPYELIAEIARWKVAEVTSGDKAKRDGGAIAKLCLFDLDGTLTDPKIGITKSVNYALNSFGIYVADLDELDKFIGPPLWESFHDFYGFTEAEVKVAVQKYREYFTEKGIFENSLYPGIIEMLENLSNADVTMAIATSKPTVFAARIAEHFGFAKYFAFIAGSELDGARSKKSEVINYALDNIDSERKMTAIMIGDREHDIIGGREAGVITVGVTWGYGARAELVEAGATWLAGAPDELYHIITNETL